MPIIDAGKEEKYRAILTGHATALKSVRFGKFWAEVAKETPTSGYDKEYFQLKPADRREGLELIKGKSAADAMGAITKHPERWRLDCSTFTRVLLGLASKDWVGKKKFAEAFERRLFFFSQESDSYTRKGISFVRENPEYKLIMLRADNYDCMKDYDDETLFQTCPVGTVFIFRNGDLDPEGVEDYRFEHTIRLGSDSFVAHGLVSGKNIMSLNELRQGLASTTHKKHASSGESLAAYAARVIWVRAALLLNTHYIEKD